MKKLHAIIFVIILFSATKAFAVEGGNFQPGNLNSQYMLQLNMIGRHKDVPEILQEKTLPATFVLREVLFQNNNSFSDTELSKLVVEKIGKSATNADLLAIKKSIILFYQQSGFPSVDIDIASTDVDEGSVTMFINEGPKNSIEIEVEPIR